MKRPRTRVEEIRLARGLIKSDLARRAGMPAQTLQHIEDGTTKSLSLSARRLLAPILQVREDQLMLPLGFPIDPIPGDQPPIDNLIYETLQAILLLMQQNQEAFLRAMQENQALLQVIADALRTTPLP